MLLANFILLLRKPQLIALEIEFECWIISLAHWKIYLLFVDFDQKEITQFFTGWMLSVFTGWYFFRAGADGASGSFS